MFTIFFCFITTDRRVVQIFVYHYIAERYDAPTYVVYVVCSKSRIRLRPYNVPLLDKTYFCKWLWHVRSQGRKVMYSVYCRAGWVHYLCQNQVTIIILTHIMNLSSGSFIDIYSSIQCIWKFKCASVKWEFT